MGGLSGPPAVSMVKSTRRAGLVGTGAGTLVGNRSLVIGISQSGASPDVIGVTVMGLLDRAWHTVHQQTVAVDRDEMIAVVADMIAAMATAPQPGARRRCAGDSH